MTKVLFIGAPLSGNLGGPSLLSSTIKLLSNFIADAEFTLLSRIPADSKLSKVYRVKVVPYTLKNLLGCLLEAILSRVRLNIFPLSRRLLIEFQTADIIIDIRGIVFADSMCRGFILPASTGIHFLIGKLLQKPVIKYTADMGPFNLKWNRFFTKFYLNKIDLILARSEKTKRYLLELGITSPIYVCPDTAFLLEPSCKKHRFFSRKMEKKFVVGISISDVVGRKEYIGDRYVTLMAKLADYLIEKLDAFVVLIPNDLFPNAYNDLHVAKQIYKKINKKGKVIILTEQYSANELKGIIGKCDLFIGARYHSIIAATSMCIPTLAISWHHKYQEVMKLLSQGEYVCDIECLNFTELRKKVDNLWKNREKVKDKMRSRVPLIKKSILLGGKLVQRVLKSETSFSSFSTNEFIESKHQVSPDNGANI